jgi:TolB protein
MRGYFHLGVGNLSWQNFMKALLAGRGFVTNGPLIEFTANNKMPGEEIQLPNGGGAVRFRGVLNSIAPIERFELVSNGKVVQSIPLSADRIHGEIDQEIRVTASGWYTLHAISTKLTHPIEDNRPMATTNPVYVIVGNRPIRNKASADYFVRWIDKLTEMANAHPGWRSDKEKQHVLAQFKEAREVYVNRGQ